LQTEKVRTKNTTPKTAKIRNQKWHRQQKSRQACKKPHQKNNRPSKPKQGQPKATSATENQTGMGENKNEKRTGQSDKL